MILRPAFAASPAAFGRRARPTPELPIARTAPAAGGDMRLFATTFAAGFLFVTVFLA